jgi:TnpA family transposase
MLGFEFAPRIADLADKRIYVPGKPGDWPNLAPLIGGPLNVKLMEQQFDEVMRLTASIKQGTVTASLILRKLAAYPRQNSLATRVTGIRSIGANTVHPQMASRSGAAASCDRRTQRG